MKNCDDSIIKSVIPQLTVKGHGQSELDDQPEVDVADYWPIYSNHVVAGIAARQYGIVGNCTPYVYRLISPGGDTAEVEFWVRTSTKQ